MTKINRRRILEEGATALIVVIFSVLLLLTISVGFMQMILQDQVRSADNELSQGAYDSALAGVEDGKRVLEACLQGGSGSAACQAINDNKCTTVSSAGLVTTTNNEVKLQTTSGTGNSFDQAYTCVIVSPDTSDYVGQLDSDASRVIPLQAASSFDHLTVAWFKHTNLSQPINLTQTGLTPVANWSPSGQVTPPVLRVQLIEYSTTSFKLTDFDASGGGNTLYLYPSAVGSTTTSFSLDARPDSAGAGIVKVKCDPTAEYICSVSIQLPNAIDPYGDPSGHHFGYLRVTSLYGQSDFSITPVGTKFHNLQPSIDATGRASDVFRRVQSRVELINPDEAQLYPRAAVDITKSFCKNFAVTADSFITPTCDYTKP